MDFIKNKIINLSPNKDKYTNLLLENCIHKKYDNILDDEILRNALFGIIIYGNIKSRCRKMMSIHSRLNTITDIEKHQIANEFEKFQRIKLNFHWIIIICLSIIIIQYIFYIKLNL
jgi:hypothetical protein